MDIGPWVLSRGEELVQKTKIGTLDAIHVASLDTFQTASGIRCAFITADARQREAANQAGLEIIWAGG